MLYRGDYIKAKEFIQMVGYSGSTDSIVKDEIVLIIGETARDTFIVEHIQRDDIKHTLTSKMTRDFLDDRFEICDRPLTRAEENCKFKLLKYLNKKYEQNKCSLECNVDDVWCNGINYILEEMISDVENDEYMKN